MSSFDPEKYGPVLANLVAGERNRPLDDTPAATLPPKMNDLSLDAAFAHAGVSDRQMAECCLSGVWLLFDDLDGSHTISQGVDTTSGSFWHGIMHRREGDFSNSKYWFRRVGDHPVLAMLAAANENGSWDPFEFVDEVEAALRQGDSQAIDRLRSLQQLEWETLFDFCYDAATA